MRTDVNWNDVQESRGDSEKLQPGGYVACIVGFVDVPYNVSVPPDDARYNKTGDYLEVHFDIAEGPFAGYYQRKNAQYPGPWQGRFRIYYSSPQYGENYGRLKALKTDIEQSNGIQLCQFDQRRLEALAQQRKLFGVLMGYDKKKHKYLNVYQTCSADKIRSGEYEIPAEWKIHVEDAPSASGYGNYGGYSGSVGFVNDDTDNDLPFD